MWGFVLMLQATATNFATLGALRTLAGATEAVAYQALLLITSMWYTRKQQVRCTMHIVDETVC